MKLSQIPKTLKLGPYKKHHPNGNGLKTLGAGKIRRSTSKKKTTVGKRRRGGRRRTGRGIGMALAALAAPIVNAISGSL